MIKKLAYILIGSVFTLILSFTWITFAEDKDAVVFTDVISVSDFDLQNNNNDQSLENSQDKEGNFEIQSLELEIEQEEENEFKMEYKEEKSKPEIKIKQSMDTGELVTDPRQFVEKLELAPTMDEQTMLETILSHLGITTFKKLELEVQFKSGEEVEFEVDEGMEIDKKDDDD